MHNLKKYQKLNYWDIVRKLKRNDIVSFDNIKEIVITLFQLKSLIRDFPLEIANIIKYDVSNNIKNNTKYRRVIAECKECELSDEILYLKLITQNDLQFYLCDRCYRNKYFLPNLNNRIL